jgi:prepilin-type processing-associated H-X9-DG protein
MCPSNLGYREGYGPWKGMDETGGFAISYGYNGAVFGQSRGIRMSELDRPSRIVFILESRYHAPGLGPWCLDYANGWRYKEGMGVFQVHIGRKANWLFADLHVQSLTVPQTCVPRNLWGTNLEGTDDGPWQSQTWWDAIVDDKHLAPEYY